MRPIPAARRVILFQSLDQAQVSFLDQIQKRETTSSIPLGDTDDQPRVGHDQLLAGRSRFLYGALQLPAFPGAEPILLQSALGVPTLAHFVGQITGIELQAGQLSLLKWTGESGLDRELLAGPRFLSEIQTGIAGMELSLPTR
jgi:hypothetical protein